MCGPRKSSNPLRAIFRVLRGHFWPPGPQFDTTALDHFGYHRTVSFSKQRQPGQVKLSSPTAPFEQDTAATVILVASCLCVTLVLMKSAGNCNAVEVSLSVHSGLMGQSLSPKGNSRGLLIYGMWLLLILFISISYTNILQSIVVVPSAHVNEHTFESMLQKHYTFEAYEAVVH